MYKVPPPFLTFLILHFQCYSSYNFFLASNLDHFDTLFPQLHSANKVFYYSANIMVLCTVSPVVWCTTTHSANNKHCNAHQMGLIDDYTLTTMYLYFPLYEIIFSLEHQPRFQRCSWGNISNETLNHIISRSENVPSWGEKAWEPVGLNTIAMCGCSGFLGVFTSELSEPVCLYGHSDTNSSPEA